tara:strand:+ start:4728 stop:5216 length:489 start_codon:yes stop_codon:yes gene_type:complete
MNNETDNQKFYVYWIYSGRCNYVGATTNPVKRLRQHCSCIQGGAKRTKGKLWTYKCVLSGFKTWRQALQCEFAIKYHSKRCRSIETRKIALEKVLNMERWTSNSPLSSDVPLKIEYDPIQYGLPPDELQTPKPKKKKDYPKRENEGDKSKRKWKKKLHGVTY